MSQTQPDDPDNLVLLHPASPLRSLSPLAPYLMTLGSITTRRLSQQIDRNGGWLADCLGCTDLPKLAKLNQDWLADTQRGLTFFVGEVNDLTQRTLREVADRVVSR